MDKKIYTEVLIQYFLENKNNSENFENFFKKFIGYLKSKDKYSLLPAIVEEFEKELKTKKEKNKTILTVREADDVKKFSKEIMDSGFDIENVEIVEDKNITGGYVLQDNEKMFDNSYKTKLLEIYKNIISS